MRNNRIATRLFIYFSVALLLLSLLIGAIFAWFYGVYTADFRRNEMEMRAKRIASSLVMLMDEQRCCEKGHGLGSNCGSYLRFIDDILMADVWLVDSEAKLITSGQGNETVTYKDLPSDAVSVIAQVYEGNVAFSQSFGTLLESDSLTCGVPILDTSGYVLGAVLLHSPIKGIGETHSQQLRILAISIVSALLLTIPISMLLTSRFTKPLQRMKQAAIELASGNYAVKTGIMQKDEIGDLAETMDLLADRLLEASKDREDQEMHLQTFFANVSHELRTPITVMRGSLEALRDGVIQEPEKVQAYHEQMLQESIQLQRFVNDLLDLSKLQNVDFQLELESLDLCEVIHDARHSMQMVSAQKGVQVEIDSSISGLLFQGDYGRLRQMLIIVLDNAVKFSPSGGSVLIQLHTNESGWTLSITDHGPGISKEDLPFIFDRFHRVKSEANHQGSGLGLTIAKKIAERHDIRLSVDVVAKGTGTVVQFLWRLC